MTMSVRALPDGGTWPYYEEQSEDNAESTGGEGDPDREDESPYTKAYIAIDGVEADDISDETEDRLRQEIITMCLTDFQLPITDVRLLREETIVEFNGE